MDRHVAALAAAVTDRGGAGEVPDSRLETEVALGQCAHWTDIHDIRRVAIVEFLARVDAQLGAVPALEDAELPGLGNLVGEADAAGAEDTALLVQHHMGTQYHGLVLFDLLLPEPRVIEPEVQIEILQVALTGLVADRTVE